MSAAMALHTAHDAMPAKTKNRKAPVFYELPRLAHRWLPDFQGATQIRKRLPVILSTQKQ